MVRDDLGSRCWRLALSALGWTADLEAAFVALERAGLRAGRVAIDFGAALRVLTAAGEEEVGLAPDLYRQARSGERPVVGDWVALAGSRATLSSSSGWPARRRSRAAAPALKARPAEQVIAANVDTAFLVTDARDFSARRIERYLAIAREASAEPVIVLTKVDLYPDVLDLLSRAVGARAAGGRASRLERDGRRVRRARLLSGAGADDLPGRLLGSREVDARESAARLRASADRAGASRWRRTAHDHPP